MSKLSGLAAVLATENIGFTEVPSTETTPQKLVLDPSVLSTDQITMLKSNIVNNDVNAKWSLEITE